TECSNLNNSKHVRSTRYLVNTFITTQTVASKSLQLSRSLRLSFDRKVTAEVRMNPNVSVHRLIVALAAVTLAMAPALAQQKPLPAVQLAKVSLPPCFQIALYAEGVPAARQMALAPDGTVFVGSFGLFSGNPKIGNVYAL